MKLFKKVFISLVTFLLIMVFIPNYGFARGSNPNRVQETAGRAPPGSQPTRPQAAPTPSSQSQAQASQAQPRSTASGNTGSTVQGHIETVKKGFESGLNKVRGGVDRFNETVRGITRH